MIGNYLPKLTKINIKLKFQVKSKWKHKQGKTITNWKAITNGKVSGALIKLSTVYNMLHPSYYIVRLTSSAIVSDK